MSLRRVFIVAAVLVAFGGTSAQALPISHQVAQNPTPSFNQQRSSSGWLQDLNLTPQQLQQIKVLRNQSKDQITQKRQAVRQAQQELEALIAGAAPSSQVRNKYNQLKTLKQQLADTQFENTLAIREILNVEQRQKFAAYMYKRS